MKTKTKISTVLLIVCALLGSHCYAKNSNDYIESYIRIWGLVKYYSSFIPTDNIRMDSIFLEDITEILKNDAKKTLIERINGLINLSVKKNFRQVDSNNFTQEELTRSKTSTWIQNNSKHSVNPVLYR